MCFARYFPNFQEFLWEKFHPELQLFWPNWFTKKYPLESLHFRDQIYKKKFDSEISQFFHKKQYFEHGAKTIVERQMFIEITTVQLTAFQEKTATM